MMDGTCDVPGCTNETYMGWAPIGEQNGKQICKAHFFRHKDPNDEFNLWDVFGFKRPAEICKPAVTKEIVRCACGRERLPRRKFCTQCAAERERQRKKRAYHERKKSQPVPVEDKQPSCRGCGEPREAGHTYWPKCAERRTRTSHRRRQSRYWKRQHSCTGSN